MVKEKKAYQQDFDDRLAVDALDTVLQHKDATMLKQTVHEVTVFRARARTHARTVLALELVLG